MVMRIPMLAVLAAMSFAGSVNAQAPAPAAPAATEAKAKYTTAATEIGTLLDDPAARAVLQKHLPDVVSNDQIEMARGMTLQSVQSYAPDVITDAKLDAIDAELASLPPK